MVYAATNPDAGFGLPDPLPNVVVYIPNSPVGPVGPISCGTCPLTLSGSPLVTTVSKVDGSFSLMNVPAGANIPLVIQAGTWRRQISVPSVPACGNTVLTPDQSRLPRNRTEGDLPHIAMVTGEADPMECVLRKMGIDQSEFSDPIPDGGHVSVYTSNLSEGAIIDAATPTIDVLMGSVPLLQTYDMLILACPGGAQILNSTEETNANRYVAGGGRIYASHYQVSWMSVTSGFSQAAQWISGRSGGGGGAGGGGAMSTAPEPVDLLGQGVSPGAQGMLSWLDLVGAAQGSTMQMGNLRNDFTVATSPAETWMTWPSNSNSPLHLTFDAPIGQSPACGRVVFADFHVDNSSSAPGLIFPSECTFGPLTAQERVLEYMLFDLAPPACEGAPPPTDGGASDAGVPTPDGG